MTGNERRTSILILFLLPLTLLISSCGDGGGYVSENRSNRGYNPGVGPFDSRGNYVERWADDRSKGRWWRKSRVMGGSDAVASTKPKPATPIPPVASNNPPVPQPTTRPTTRPAPPVGGVASATPRAKPKPKPKPKRTVKVKPKRKSPIRYTVKKGDTLWSISRRYKTTVTAIQRANGLKGTNLRIGRSLLIPRY